MDFMLPPLWNTPWNVAMAPTVAIRSPTAAPLAGVPLIHVAGGFSRETPGRTTSTGQTSPVEWHANGWHPMPNPWPSWPSWLCQDCTYIWVDDHPRMKWVWNGMQVEKHWGIIQDLRVFEPLKVKPQTYPNTALDMSTWLTTTKFYPNRPETFHIQQQ